MSGNEAIARGAVEARVRVGAGYPGTPSTEILETLATYPDVYVEWSVNEKVALELGLGAALAGARSLVTMKHVGVNVAADPLFTAAYTGVQAGLVIVSADDPALHSSQNEQDNRHYARAAKLPMLEPSDSDEARQFTRLAFELSERHDIPVMLRTTTRIAHSSSPVHPEPPVAPSQSPKGFQRNRTKYVMIPLHAGPRHVDLERRMAEIARLAETIEINRIEPGDPAIGFVTSGICYQYIKEIFPNASILKLGLIHPLPEALIRKFSQQVKRIIVVEELDPFFEDQIKAWGIPVEGKKYFSNIGELSPGVVRDALQPNAVKAPLSSSYKLPARPPALCPGCPHRTVFGILNRLGCIVAGDIGCYTLAALPPFSAMDTQMDMGAGITMAQGMEIAGEKNVVAVIGDSTFAHSGVAGLMNAAYNGRNELIIVLDNGTTAMTGLQPNPLSGERIRGEPAVALDYKLLAGAVGIPEDRVRIVNAYDPPEVEKAIVEMKSAGKLALLVVKGPCLILRRRKKA
ncbi:MAG: thiamine pyrophosphate-dependent enzyme [Candidatus Sumerlaeota bacterium]|nr:thiamine pyrophosphate-dependent enzyme [Candidatus Sumerlaeota bacterium]